MQYKTRILDNPDGICKQIRHIAESSSGLYIIAVSGGMQLIYNKFSDLYKNILDKHRKELGTEGIINTK